MHIHDEVPNRAGRTTDEFHFGFWVGLEVQPANHSAPKIRARLDVLDQPKTGQQRLKEPHD